MRTFQTDGRMEERAVAHTPSYVRLWRAARSCLSPKTEEAMLYGDWRDSSPVRFISVHRIRIMLLLLVVVTCLYWKPIRKSHPRRTVQSFLANHITCDAFATSSQHFEFTDSIADDGPITIVLMGYKRSRKTQYHCMLKEYRSMCGLVAKIIVVWNNQNVEPPPVPAPRQWTRCHIPVIIERSSRNSLNNRFIHTSQYITTPAVLSIDDDLLISYSLLSCMFSHWLMDRDRIVGAYPRLIVPPNGTYVSGWKREENAFEDDAGEEYTAYNTMLTGCAVFDRRFLDVYAAETEVHPIVDEGMNGEDILFNAVIQNLTKKAPLSVTPSTDAPLMPFQTAKDQSSLHTRTTWEEWLAERSKVGAWALDRFGDDVFHLTSKEASCRHRDLRGK